MRVIGVVDLLDGRAVHARAGRRDEYAPVEMAAGAAIPAGDPLALARRYVTHLGVPELYVADLDAILDPTSGQTPNGGLIASLASIGVPLWLDAAVWSVEHAQHALALGAARVVVGLETLPSCDVLDDICAGVGGDRVAFSLDLRDGKPVRDERGASRASGPDESAPQLASRAAVAGAGAVIVIDLARVGMGRGPDFELITRIRAAVPDLILLAGGGVRGPGDLARLAAGGCDGVLVATALHDGRLGAADVAAARQLNVTR